MVKNNTVRKNVIKLCHILKMIFKDLTILPFYFYHYRLTVILLPLPFYSSPFILSVSSTLTLMNLSFLLPLTYHFTLNLTFLSLPFTIFLNLYPDPDSDPDPLILTLILTLTVTILILHLLSFLPLFWVLRIEFYLHFTLMVCLYFFMFFIYPTLCCVYNVFLAYLCFTDRN